MVDANEGLLGIEWIDGETVKGVLPTGTIGDNPSEEWSESVGGDDHNCLDKFGISLGISLGTVSSDPHAGFSLNGLFKTCSWVLLALKLQGCTWPISSTET